ncbi:MAG TPA: hypothetical protein PK760_14780, partial [Flavobacteriales bacterium]|nr:hypothetical protein [Flavobacteriales bacterium]
GPRFGINSALLVSRMLGLCKDLKADVLISAELLARLPLARERFAFGEEQVIPVKGKKREVRTHTVRRERVA